MCKPVLVTLPFVLLLLDYWPLRRFELKRQNPSLKPLLPLVLEKLPFFALAVVSSLVTVMAHRGLGMLDAASGPPLEFRMENAVVSYVRYLGGAIWPMNLAVFYPYPAAWPMGKVALSGLLLLGVSGLAIRIARKRPYLLVGWFWFLGVLVPFIGLVQAGAQAMADRFAYVPLLGLFLALVWGTHEVAARRRYGLAALSAVAVAAAVLCAALTHRQISYWKDDESLFSRALAVTENNGLAQLNLGAALNVKGRFDEAIGHFKEAIRLSPGTANAYINLAYALAQKHRLGEAVQQYEAALRLNPGDAGVHNDLGLTLARQGRVEEAIAHYTEALRLKAGFAEAHYNLGLTLAKRGQYAEAGAQFEEAIRLNPKQANARQKLAQVLADQAKLERVAEPYREALRSNPRDARAHSELGRLLLEAGRVAEAIEQCAAAARLEPKSAEAQYQLGAALAREGEGKKAARQFELAVELDPNFAAGHYALGIVRQQQDRMPEALKHWREAARLAPHWADPLNNLAWALATDAQPEPRDGVEAVKLASRAVELSGTNNVGVLDTLAAAYAEAGRFAEACSVARQAQTMAEAQGLEGLAEKIRLRLTLYGLRQPYRDGP
jgi:tetratricopeptide (TPR) repeat protein